MSSGALALLLLAASPTDGIHLDAGLFAALPSALGTGQLLGPSLGAFLELGDWALGSSFRLGFVEENDLVWQMSHTELRATVGGARAWHIGRGTFSLGLSAGVLFVHESRLRHQAARLASVGLPVEESSWATGPFASLDAAVRVYFYDPLWLGAEGGPTLALLRGEDELALRPGWWLGISFGYAFGRDTL
jgi:hypothetical protein